MSYTSLMSCPFSQTPPRNFRPLAFVAMPSPARRPIWKSPSYLRPAGAGGRVAASASATRRLRAPSHAVTCRLRAARGAARRRRPAPHRPASHAPRHALRRARTVCPDVSPAAVLDAVRPLALVFSAVGPHVAAYAGAHVHIPPAIVKLALQAAEAERSASPAAAARRSGRARALRAASRAWRCAKRLGARFSVRAARTELFQRKRPLPCRVLRLNSPSYRFPEGYFATPRPSCLSVSHSPE